MRLRQRQPPPPLPLGLPRAEVLLRRDALKRPSLNARREPGEYVNQRRPLLRRREQFLDGSPERRVVDPLAALLRVEARERIPDDVLVERSGVDLSE